jgi:hypothetical protein
MATRCTRGRYEVFMGYARIKYFVLLIVAVAVCVRPVGANETSNAAIPWISAALQGIRDSKLGAPMAARALAIVNTCMYDAWAAYDDRAVGTQLRDALAARPPSAP